MNGDSIIAFGQFGRDIICRRQLKIWARQRLYPACNVADGRIDAAVRALSEVMYNDEYAIIREYAIAALEQIDPPSGT